MGAGSSINTQRYRDSVSSLQSVLQKQYSDVNNVSNDKIDISNASADPEIADNCSGLGLGGHSNCVILGRYITTSSDGKALLVNKVVGCDCSVGAASPLLDDVEIFKGGDHGYTTFVSSTMKEQYDLEWGSQLVKKDGSPMQFSMLILLSPNTGITRTFINPNKVFNTDSVAGSLITEDALNNQSVMMCVSGSTPRSAVLISANSTSANSIEVLGGGDASNECN